MRSKTTVILSDRLMRELKRRAAERGETLSAAIEATLRRGLDRAGPATGAELPPLPAHWMGRPKVDLADRDRLYTTMEED